VHETLTTIRPTLKITTLARIIVPVHDSISVTLYRNGNDKNKNNVFLLLNGSQYAMAK